MGDNGTTIGFAVAGGADEFYDQSKLLIRSIESNVEGSYHVTTFVPEEELGQLSRQQVAFYKEHGKMVSDEYPIKEYKITAKLAALREAQKREADVHVMLDCDTLVVDDLKDLRVTSEGDTDLLLCPEHGGWTYWATPAAREEWQEVYSLAGAEFPGYQMRAVFDGTPMPPYWNAGVVVTRRKIAEEWLELVKRIWERFGPGMFYTDQLALSVLGNRYGVSPMSVEYNYPSYMYLRCPSDVKILHYSSLWHLGRIVNPNIRRKLVDIGAYEMEAVPRGRDRVRAIGHGLGVRIFREIVRKRWPWLKRALGR
jgi:hypothetical protein